MAFSTLRGRPPRPRLDDNDAGTPELQFKRALGVTREPIDLCLERKLITPDQHWCSLHLRWLYTLRYGAPVTTTRYADKDTQCPMDEDKTHWRALREKEYHVAVIQLQRARLYEPVMRVSVFNETPAFLSATLMHRAWAQPTLTQELERSHRTLVRGLDILVSEWKPQRSNHRNPKVSGHDFTKMLL